MLTKDDRMERIIFEYLNMTFNETLKNKSTIGVGAEI